MSLLAHEEAYKKARIVHRDISAGNIMIDKNGDGLLIDWDLSRSLDTTYPGELDVVVSAGMPYCLACTDYFNL